MYSLKYGSVWCCEGESHYRACFPVCKIENLGIHAGPEDGLDIPIISNIIHYKMQPRPCHF